MGLVGAKLAAIPNASIALAWPIFFPFVLLAVSQFFRQLLSLKSEAHVYMLLLKSEALIGERSFSSLLSFK